MDSQVTDIDYKDIINPIGKMEREAEQRGYRRGILTAIWWLLCAVVAGLVLVSLKAHAAEAPRWSVEHSTKPIKASDRKAVITVCHSNSVRMGYQCFSVR